MHQCSTFERVRDDQDHFIKGRNSYPSHWNVHQLMMSELKEQEERLPWNGFFEGRIFHLLLVERLLQTTSKLKLTFGLVHHVIMKHVDFCQVSILEFEIRSLVKQAHKSINSSKSKDCRRQVIKSSVVYIHLNGF